MSQENTYTVIPIWKSFSRDDVVLVRIGYGGGKKSTPIPHREGEKARFFRKANTLTNTKILSGQINASEFWSQPKI